MSKMDKQLKRFIKLGWEILEHKYRYYIQNTQTIGDEQYDKLEEEYRRLAITLGYIPYSSNMVGFDMNRESCRIVRNRMEEDIPPEYRREK